MSRFIGFLFCIILSPYLFAQTLTEAQKLYEEGHYAQVRSFYEQRVKSSPNNAENNLRYGVCLKETGYPEEAEKYLQTAYKRKSSEAGLQLADLYYGQYRFAESVSMYEPYLNSLKSNRPEEKTKIDSLLRQAENAARMLKFCEDIQIIDSIIVDKNHFLEAYYLSETSGKVGFMKDRTVFYENQLGDKRYFSFSEEKRSFRLYSIHNYAGQWTDPMPMAISPEDRGDQQYPFVLPDGVTIYYASTGENSIGGYDLFVTRYNSANDTYYASEQLGMPFNSIYNDYMLAIDEFNGIGYFATDRFMQPGQVIVYTFIPESEKVILEGKTPEELKRRAEIVSIRDSWKSGQNYAGMLLNIRKSIQNEQKPKIYDFVFVINDQIVYHTLNDFTDAMARNWYVQAASLKEQESVLTKQLENDRQVYSNANDAEKQRMAPSILTNEAKLESMQKEYEELIVKSRNAEIKRLRNEGTK